ncbi:hypothetical protein BFJ69_g16749 [Fusarium oxysporum]|uniref:Uncharacterized protein n=1 Tax=Fusarium oxysporum TaxID=5507 RepID=A0A420MA91_FUSOX|nr:hypothetical protein BFJ69_g16749 [Fusarium oxysporum]
MKQDESPTIYNMARLCSELFERILESTDSGSPLFLPAEELRGRFHLWAAYLGVYAVPRASVDARLDDDKKTKNMLLELLAMVQRNLQWGECFPFLIPLATDRLLTVLQN